VKLATLTEFCARDGHQGIIFAERNIPVGQLLILTLEPGDHVILDKGRSGRADVHR